MSTPSNQTWLTTSEVAAVIRETRANVSRRCKRGEIQATRVGRNWRISQAALDNFLTPEPTQAESVAEPLFLTADQKRRAGGAGVSCPSKAAVQKAGEILAAGQRAAEQMTARELAEAAWEPMCGVTVDELEDEIREHRRLPPIRREGTETD